MKICRRDCLVRLLSLLRRFEGIGFLDQLRRSRHRRLRRQLADLPSHPVLYGASNLEPDCRCHALREAAHVNALYRFVNDAPLFVDALFNHLLDDPIRNLNPPLGRSIRLFELGFHDDFLRGRDLDDDGSAIDFKRRLFAGPVAAGKLFNLCVRCCGLLIQCSAMSGAHTVSRQTNTHLGRLGSAGRLARGVQFILERHIIEVKCR